jgi:hypothetical protein
MSSDLQPPDKPLSDDANDTVQMLVEFIADMKLGPILDAYIRGRDRDGDDWEARNHRLRQEIY